MHFPKERTADMMLKTVLFAGLALAANGVFADTWYVDDAAGSDSNDGSEGAPFKTIGKAFDLGSDVLKDGHVVVKPGRYHLNGTPLVKNLYCTLRSESGNPADTIIDADGLSECARFVGANGEKFKKPMRVIGFTFTNGAKPVGNASVACCLNVDSNVIVSNCVVTGNIDTDGKVLKYPPVFIKNAQMVSCTISNNAVSGDASAVQLASNGVFCSGVIVNNTVNTGIGAPVYAYTGGFLEDTVVSNNVAPVNTGLVGTPQEVSGCLFASNLCTIGSVRDCGTVSIFDYAEKGRPEVSLITNCTVAGNYVSNPGLATCAGVRIREQPCVMVDCVVSNNFSRRYTGVYATANNGEHVLISGCVVAGNKAEADSGGGAYLGNGVTVTNSLFYGNTAHNVGGGILGVGFTMIDCVISNNSAKVGAGVCVCTNGVLHASITGTLFAGNTASYAGGGLSVGYMQKASTANTNGYAKVSDCTFLENSARSEGTDYAGGGAVYMTSGYKSAGYFDRCVFKGNRSRQYGGAFSVRDASATSSGVAPVVVRNSLFVDNRSTGGEKPANCLGGAMYLVKSDPMIVENCTFDGNGVDEGGANSDIHIRWAGVRVRNCIFNAPNVESHDANRTSYETNCFRSAELELPSKVQKALGNFAVADVGFSGPENDDWSLRRDSPCINAAALLGWMTEDATDIAGGKRVSGSGPDLGSYEHQFPFGLRMVFR